MDVEYSFIAITPRSTMVEVVVPVKLPSMSQIDLYEIGYNYVKPYNCANKWLVWVLWHINSCWLFNAKFWL